MRLRNVKNAKEKLEASPFFISNPKEFKGQWQNVFSKQSVEKNPIHLEIGAGKGQFLIAMAKKNPDMNFIGIEKYESVLVRAIEKVNQTDLKNIVFICVDAMELREIFDHEIATIYLNFSDPWPKSRHAKRRLTSPIFLNIYDHVFKNNPMIIQKTDNLDLFSYSLETLSQHGYCFLQVSLHLQDTQIANVETEYEQKFKEKGIKINYLKACKK